MPVVHTRWTHCNEKPTEMWCVIFFSPLRWPTSFLLENTGFRTRLVVTEREEKVVSTSHWTHRRWAHHSFAYLIVCEKA
eukprot:17218_3